MGSSSPRPPARNPAPAVIALYGPTASGKTAVAGRLRELLDAEVVSADSAALYAGLPVLTAAPDYPARLVGVVPLSEEVSVGAYQALAHAAIDEAVSAGRTAIVVGGTGLYLRAALAGLELPPPPEPGERERWEALYAELGPEGAHRVLAQRDAAAAARVHANDRRRVVRALELAATGRTLAPATDRLWTDDTRHPTLLLGLEVAEADLDERIAARAQGMAAAGAAAEARAAWQGPLSSTARQVMGLAEFATLPEDEAVAATTQATRRLARYQRKWLRRLPGTVRLDGARPAAAIADEILALGRTGERLPRR
jgi:tRNA dimethylallyltransferase